MIKLKIKFLLYIGILLSSALTYAQRKPTSTEKTFIEHTRNCYHLAGEVGDQTPERTKELNKSMGYECPRAIKLAKKLLAKPSQHSSTYQAFLQLHELSSDSESTKLKPEQLKRFCAKPNNVDFKKMCDDYAIK
jgi:hypothetical protein